MNTAFVLRQIDDILDPVHPSLSFTSDTEISLHVTRISAAIARLAPNSHYKKLSEDTIKQYGLANSYTAEILVGVLHALRKDYQAGYLQEIESLIQAGVFSDFMEMATHLLSQGYKDPAAVLGGGVLEEHLRKLSLKHALPLEKEDGTPHKTDFLNAALAKASVYSILEQKTVTAWLDLRNKAAHGKYAEYNEQQVENMLQGISGFLSRTS